nr:uncharacterized protein LOC118878536 [Drosophila suzukii]
MLLLMMMMTDSSNSASDFLALNLTSAFLNYWTSGGEEVGAVASVDKREGKWEGECSTTFQNTLICWIVDSFARRAQINEYCVDHLFFNEKAYEVLEIDRSGLFYIPMHFSCDFFMDSLVVLSSVCMEKGTSNEESAFTEDASG